MRCPQIRTRSLPSTPLPVQIHHSSSQSTLHFTESAAPSLCNQQQKSSINSEHPVAQNTTPRCDKRTKRVLRPSHHELCRNTTSPVSDRLIAQYRLIVALPRPVSLRKHNSLCTRKNKLVCCVSTWRLQDSSMEAREWGSLRGHKANGEHCGP